MFIYLDISDFGDVIDCLVEGREIFFELLPHAVWGVSSPSHVYLQFKLYIRKTLYQMKASGAGYQAISRNEMICRIFHDL